MDNTVPQAVVDLKPWINDIILPLFGAAATGAVTVLIAFFAKKLGVDKTNAIRDSVQKTAVNAVNYAVSQLHGIVDHTNLTVDTKSRLIGVAANYVEQQARDNLDKLGASSDDVERMVEAKLGALLLTGVDTHSIVVNPSTLPAGMIGGPAKVPGGDGEDHSSTMKPIADSADH